MLLSNSDALNGDMLFYLLNPWSRQMRSTSSRLRIKGDERVYIVGDKYAGQMLSKYFWPSYYDVFQFEVYDPMASVLFSPPCIKSSFYL